MIALGVNQVTAAKFNVARLSYETIKKMKKKKRTLKMFNQMNGQSPL